MDNVVALTALTLTGTIATGFFALIRQQNKVHEKIAEAMDKVATSNGLIAKEAKQGNKEAKERNGHLAELVIQTGENTISAVQNVEHQHVDSQVIDSKVIKEAQ